ncbi:uncharacterized protein LOC120904557 [Anopheles arabiensis]|uniref:uncharacterized protein LOC120904557 n=1 Tax=Anopheles arabiensis TaxID=7173 RepID=UPI001AAE072B|nr:uncharacterized protein LOC120904557 [Anopheles arabiensis]
MAAYIVIPVIVLTIMAIWFMVYMYDKRIKPTFSSTSTPATTTTCTNVRQEGGIVYTISNTPNNGGATGMARPASDLNSGATHIRIEPDGRGGPPPQYGGYTSQNLIVVTTIPRDLPPSYDQVVTSRNDPPISSNSNDTAV